VKRERTRKPQAPVARVCATHVRDTETRESDSPLQAAGERRASATPKRRARRANRQEH